MHHDETKTTPIGIVRYANEFYEACIAVNDVIGIKPEYGIVAPHPVLYLAGHSIELALKAFLLKGGIPLRKLPTKTYGHDLMKCFKKANELGLISIHKFDQVEVGAIRLLNELYCSKQLNYIVTGEKLYPTFNLVQAFAKKLIDVVSMHVGYKHNT